MILYKFRNFFKQEHTLDILRDQRLYCAKYTDLNDPFEGMLYVEGYGFDNDRFERVTTPQTVQSYLLENNLTPRICSLSSDPWNVMLWGLYAASSSGIAIEFDFSDHEPLEAKKVVYNENYPFHQEGVSYFHDEEFHEVGPPSLESILLNKSARWGYEAEYRIITDKEYFSVSGLISRVIVGPNISVSNYNLVEKHLPSGVEIVEAEFDFEKEAVRSELHPDYLLHHDHPWKDYEDPLW